MRSDADVKNGLARRNARFSKQSVLRRWRDSHWQAIRQRDVKLGGVVLVILPKMFIIKSTSATPIR
jgi:hypothetical protein